MTPLLMLFGYLVLLAVALIFNRGAHDRPGRTEPTVTSNVREPAATGATSRN